MGVSLSHTDMFSFYHATLTREVPNTGWGAGFNRGEATARACLGRGEHVRTQRKIQPTKY